MVEIIVIISSRLESFTEFMIVPKIVLLQHIRFYLCFSRTESKCLVALSTIQI